MKMTKSELWKLVKENNRKPGTALKYYTEYRNCGGKKIIRAYEGFYQGSNKVGTK